MERIRTVATFVAGVLVGGAAVYFSPPEGSDALTTGAGMPGPRPTEGATLPDGSKPPLPPLDGPGAVPAVTVGAPVANVEGAPPVITPPTPPVVTPEAPPLEELPAAPADAPPASGSRLERHLRNAPTLWANALGAARASQGREAKALALEVEAHIATLPAIGEHMPPLQEIASYLASSRVLLDRLAAAGVDVAELSLQVDVLMRPPRGKIPGGPKSEAPPG